MEITEVRVLLKDSPDKKLKAYATVTFDNVFVIRNIKVIEGLAGAFIAMPSRKVKHPCPKCGFKNELRSKYCNQCAQALPIEINTQSAQSAQNARSAQDAGASQAEHKDIAHPITQVFREHLQRKVLEAYEQEKKKGMSV